MNINPTSVIVLADILTAKRAFSAWYKDVHNSAEALIVVRARLAKLIKFSGAQKRVMTDRVNDLALEADSATGDNVADLLIRLDAIKVSIADAETNDACWWSNIMDACEQMEEHLGGIYDRK